MHCHHEKLVIVDDELAFVGGIDLTTLAGDRYDTNAHPHKEQAIGWHDACALLRGPIVRDVAAHFALRWEATAGEALALPEEIAPAGDTTVQFTRTVPEGAYRVLPRGEFSVLETYIRALRSAQQPDLPREPVPVVAGDRQHPRDQAAPAAERRLPRRRPAPAQGQQRPGRHARDARPPRRRRRRAGELPRRHDPVALRRALRAAVRARQDRDRRRRVAGDRLGQPQRALAVQRHRGRRRHLRPGARARHPAAAVGGAPRAARGRRRRARSSTPSGARSRASSSSGAPPARRSPTTWSSCRASAAARDGCSARSTRWWSTVERGLERRACCRRQLVARTGASNGERADPEQEREPAPLADEDQVGESQSSIPRAVTVT